MAYTLCMTVINLFPQQQQTYVSGEALCTACGHEWAHSFAAGEIRFECPECHTERGLAKYPVIPKEYWTCLCGGTLFYVCRDGFLCRECGLKQAFP